MVCGGSVGGGGKEAVVLVVLEGKGRGDAADAEGGGGGLTVATDLSLLGGEREQEEEGFLFNRHALG